jgi:hypothetical protein
LVALAVFVGMAGVGLGVLSEGERHPGGGDLLFAALLVLTGCGGLLCLLVDAVRQLRDGPRKEP